MQNINTNIIILRDIISDKNFNDLIQKLSGERWIYSENEIDLLMKSYAKELYNSPLLKDFLIRNHIISRLYSYSYTDTTKLRCEYISNVNRDTFKDGEIISYLESRLKSFQLGLNNSKRKIHIKGVISDYRNFYNKTKMYSLNTNHINKSVIIASLYDALLSRRFNHTNFLNLYFDDDTYGKYYIQCGSESKRLEEIRNNVKKLLIALRKSVHNEDKITKKPAKLEINIDEEISWINHFDKMQNDPRTFRFRQFIINKINAFLKINSSIDDIIFESYIKELASIYKESNSIPKSPENGQKINEIYKYLFHYNLDMLEETKEKIYQIIPEENNIKYFLVKLFRVYLATNFAFLCRFGTQYNNFYFTFAKSYVTVIGTPSRAFIESFSMIISRALRVNYINAA